MSDSAFSHLDRRQLLLGLGGTAVASAALAACGGNTGRQSSSSSSSGGGGAKPAIAQWYHQYGEAGTQQAVERYAAAYPDAKVTVTWKPGDYDQSTAASLLTDAGPDVFEYGNGPTIDMIKGNQVVDMTDLFGDSKGDFNDAVLKRVTYDGKIWAIPQVIDMQLLVYRTSMLDKAGVQPPTTMDGLVSATKELTTSKVKGLFLGNDGGVSLMGGPMLWSVGLDYLTDDNQFGFDDPKAAEAFTVLRNLFTSKDLLLGAPADWFDPSALTQGLTAMQFTGLWNFPDIEKALGDDYGCVPWPSMDGGAKSVPVGAYGSCVSSKAKDVNASKAFAKWLWIDQTADQLDFATAYGFHIPSRESLLSKAKTLQSGPAKDAAQYAVEFGHAQSPLLWTPKCQTAFGDMMTKIVKDGADPAKQIAACRTVADAELKRVQA